MLVKNKDNFAIILCGGSGTRLWPYSRASKPKQFLSFDGDKTLFQKTILRVRKFFKDENIYIVTNEKFYFETKGQLSDLNINDTNIIREPESKNTLPAISYGVREINKVSKNAIIGVFSSDHEIDNNESFVESCQNGILPVKDNKFVVFGIQPTEANIGYGYIKPGDNYITTYKDIFSVLNFVEKPDESTAKKYVKKGYLWNSGMFMFNAKLFLKTLQTYQNDIFENIINSDEDLINLNYSKVPDLSIDYGLLEFVNNIVVVKAKYNWTDLGSWNSIHSHLNEKNIKEVQSQGNVISENVTNSLILSNDHLIAAYGLKDMIVVHDLDATLICHKAKADHLKPFIESIRKKNSNYITDHPEVNRPWGSYKVLHQSETFKIKSIIVNSKQKLSLQLHRFRNEHWVVIRGTASVVNGDQYFELKENESTYIKKNNIHRLENNTDSVLEIIEVSIGKKVIEEDIVRFDDMYERN